MSLVSEALRKAEREAARRRAEAEGLPAPLLASAQPYRAKSRSRLGRGLAVVLLVALGVVLGLVARDGERRSTRAATAVERPTEDDVRPAPVREAAVSTPQPASDRTSRLVTPATLPATEPTRERERPAPEVAAADGAEAAADGAQAAARSSTTQRFVREARLADGTQLRLRGIAWSESAPLAYLNGQLLAVGESVAGWRLSAIGRDEVTLTGAGGEVRIALR